MKYLFTIFSVMLILSITCCNDDSEFVEAIIPNKFLGEFNIESVHVSGIQTIYDSDGNIIFQGYDTTTVSNEILTISKLSEENDTLIINKLINTFTQGGIGVKGIVINDSLRILHDFSTPQTRNNYIRGNIWFEADSLFLDYIWDRSDIWSTGALPERGMVVAKGK